MVMIGSLCLRANVMQVGHPRHRAVLLGDLADHAGRGQAGDPRQIDRRLGVAGPDEHAALARPQREHVARLARGRAASSPDRCAARIVIARSGAETPVATCLASIDTHIGVPRRDELSATASGISSASSRSGVIARQSSPRACVIMKLTASGVTRSAAIVRSPSFSRSSSSTTTIIPPARIAATRLVDGRERRRGGRRAGSGFAGAGFDGCATRFDGAVLVVIGPAGAGPGVRASARRTTYFPTRSHSRFTGVADPGRRQRRVRPGVRNDLDVEPLVVERGDGQADAVDRNRALEDHPGRQIGRKANAQAAELAFVGDRRLEGADAVDVSLDDVPAEPAVGAQRPLQVDRPARRRAAPSAVTRRVSGDTSMHHGGPSRRITVRQTPLVARLSPSASSGPSVVSSSSTRAAGLGWRRRARVPVASMSPVNIGFDQDVVAERLGARSVRGRRARTTAASPTARRRRRAPPARRSSGRDRRRRPSRPRRAAPARLRGAAT